MKRNHLFGILIASLISSAIVPIPTFATTNINITEVPVPTKAELESAIAEVKSLPGYTAYSSGMDNTTREHSTSLFREYRYLAELTMIADRMIAYYDYQPASDLQDIYRAAKDAVIACRLIFANTKNTVPATSSTTSTATPSVRAEITVSTPEIAPELPEFIIAGEPEADNPSATINPENSIDPAQDSNTTTATESPEFNLLTASATAAAIANSERQASPKTALSPTTIDQTLTTFSIISTPPLLTTIAL